MDTAKLSERRVALTMPAEELAALDQYCASQRRATGDAVARADVIRQAIRELIGRHALTTPTRR